MTEVPCQKKVTFFDSGSGDMNSVNTRLFWYRTWNDEQSRYFQYCLMDGEKRCFLQKSSAARRHFAVALTTLRFDGFRDGQCILVALVLPPATGDYLAPFGYRITTWPGGQIT